MNNINLNKYLINSYPVNFQGKNNKAGKVSQPDKSSADNKNNEFTVKDKSQKNIWGLDFYRVNYCN